MLKRNYSDEIINKEFNNTCVTCEKEFISNSHNNFCSSKCRNLIKSKLVNNDVIKKYEELKSLKETSKFFNISVRTIREILRNN